MQASSSHRQSTQRFGKMGEKAMCPANAGDRQHANQMHQRQSEDTKHGQENAAWEKSFNDMKGARDAWQKDQGNADKKKKFDDANKRFMDASTKHAQSNRDWKSKNDGHQKADREWENNKGMTPPAPPADPVSMVAPPANLRAV